jgi:protein SCO1/2
LKLALVESSEGRIGGLAEEILLFCYHYDPESGRYGFVILNIVRVAGVATVLGLAGFILLALRRERRGLRAS